MKHASETQCITCASKAKLQFLNTVKRNKDCHFVCISSILQKNMLQNFPELYMLKNKLWEERIQE